MVAAVTSEVVTGTPVVSVNRPSQIFLMRASTEAAVMLEGLGLMISEEIESALPTYRAFVGAEGVISPAVPLT